MGQTPDLKVGSRKRERKKEGENKQLNKMTSELKSLCDCVPNGVPVY